MNSFFDLLGTDEEDADQLAQHNVHWSSGNLDMIVEGQLFGLQETIVKTKNFCKVFTNFGQEWAVMANYSKHDAGRIWLIVNDRWLDTYPGASASFVPEGLMDHSPCCVHMQSSIGNIKKPFRLFNIWTEAPNFRSLVQEAWETETHSTTMFCVVQKHKERADAIADEKLIEAQMRLVKDPLNLTLVELEFKATQDYNVAHATKLCFLKHKAKAHWLKEGDMNSAFFHDAIRQRRVQNRICSIQSASGGIHSPDDITEVFVEYYKGLLGTGSTDCVPVHPEVIAAGPFLTKIQKELLCRTFSEHDVQAAIWSIEDNKAPGPDGFTSKFFKAAWSIVMVDVCKAVLDFFEHGRLLKQINSTTLTLIPKVTNATQVTQFRPIACCNILYKVISKLVAARMKEVLPGIISVNQSAFISGRSIIDNIMLC
ncbi:uncharacterized protein LOC110686554 [Chenopodium quinoa]|uniref:uncharacterized protein LOC110686554 n=1 Tax=Chenopodium quinoa TaxID=63459 RepID=UPI000B7768A6|nr:uncharacterized protein LOC110686554 [Chenopodium quinoa]